MRSRGPPSASSTVEPRGAEAAVGQQASASAAAPAPSDVSARMRAPGCRCGRIRSSGRPCRRDSAVSCSGQPSRAAARLKGGRRRHDEHLVRVDVARQQSRRRRRRTDRREASTQTARPRMREHVASRASNGLGHGRAAPRISAPRQREMPLAAEHELGVGDQPARHRRREPLDAVLADADDGQPAARCGSLRSAADMSDTRAFSSSAAPRGPAARRTPRRPCRSRGHAVARRPHRAPGRPARAGAGRRLRRRRGPGGLSRRRSGSTLLIDATHPYADANLGQCRASGARRPACRSLRCGGPAWTRGRRRPLDRGRRRRRRRRARSAKRRAASSSPRPARGRRVRGGAAAPLSDPQRRSGRAAAARCRDATISLARGPFREADERALLEQHRIEVVVAKNSGGEATYGKIAAARALGHRGGHAAPARPARCACGRNGAKRASRWLDHVLGSGRRRAACRPAAAVAGRSMIAGLAASRR